MISKQSIHRILIKWSVEEEVIISMMLSKGGSLNRIGNGEKSGGKMAMGRTEEPLFESLLEAMPEDWLKNTGRYTLPDPKGKMAQLTLVLETEDEQETGFEFTYGIQSGGPPEDFVEYVEYAIELTDEWYENMTRKGKK
ncbi:MAG: hypothetical protein MRZ79_06365 [Bacteroidia bacterium]|nr:hypothetical protein [Bacteroidia bacterium]